MIIHQQQTAIDAYQAFCASGKRRKQADKVWRALELLGSASDEQMSNFTGIGIRQISARRNEWEDMIEQCGTTTARSGTKVIMWRTAQQPSLFKIKRLSKAKKIQKACEEMPGELADRILKILKT